MPLPALIAAAQEIEIKGVFLEPRRARTLDLKKSPIIETNHIAANHIAADQMARRVAPMMVEHGWGRSVQARHDEPPAHFALWCLEGSARDGDRRCGRRKSRARA